MHMNISGAAGDKCASQSAFDIANGYFEGALRCASPVADPYLPGGIVCPMPPTISCIAFAAEMYMKSLVLGDGQTVLKSHRFDKLFSLLPLADQQSVRRRFRIYTGLQSLAIPEQIKQFANAFVDWRYAHEGTSNVRLDYLFDFSRSLFETVRANHPEWVISQYMTERITAPVDSPVLQVTSLGGGAMVRVTKKAGG